MLLESISSSLLVSFKIVYSIVIVINAFSKIIMNKQSKIKKKPFD